MQDKTYYDLLLLQQSPLRPAFKFALLLAGSLILVDLMFLLLYGPIIEDAFVVMSNMIVNISLVIVSVYYAATQHRNEQLEGYLPVKRILKTAFHLGWIAGFVYFLFLWFKNEFLIDVTLVNAFKLETIMKTTDPSLSLEEYEEMKAINKQVIALSQTPVVLMFSTILSYIFWTFIGALLLANRIKNTATS
jgi:hypothetical protein